MPVLKVANVHMNLLGSDRIEYLSDNVIRFQANAIQVPIGTTDQRSASGNGRIRFNTDLNRLETYINSEWDAIATANTLVGDEAFTKANAANIIASLAYDKANNALPNTTATFNGNLTIGGSFLRVSNIHHDASGFTRTQISTANTITFYTSNQEQISINASGYMQVAGEINAASLLINGVAASNISNSYAVSVGAASNAYAASVGASSNAWTNTVFGFSNTKFLANSTTTYAGDLTIIGTGNVSSSFRAASLGVGAAASGTVGEIRAANNITAYFSSDKRFKENIRDIENAVNIIDNIGGKYFDWTDKYVIDHGGEDGYFIRKSDFGVIAQDVQDVFPIAVRERQDGTLAVDYEKLVALAFAAIKELKAEIDELKKGR